jgi:KDO2-lipid IV(A) lauroyltransferase
MSNLERIFYNATEILFRLIGLVPRKSAIGIAGLLGKALFRVDRKHRKIVIDNLIYAFGHQKSTHEIQFLAKQVFINLLQVVFEIGWSLKQDERQLVKHFKIDGYRHIKKSYEKGKGVLVLTAHFGNWELLTVIGAMIKFPLSIVVRPLDFKPLDHFFFNLRTRFGGKIIPKKRSFRKILESLNRGEMVALLMDQNVDWYEGVFAKFMGRRACTNHGLALLALKTGAPVVPVFMVREKTGLKGKFGQEIPFIKTGDSRKDIEVNTRQYNKAIEDMIYQYPEQWFWVHQRWKTKPYLPLPVKTDN